ncbi:hypothetical protein DIPPA_33070 [Diplonema papillatum]|nr:hypothetical protein DIPPA_33070 [Diplonema papillatum]
MPAAPSSFSFCSSAGGSVASPFTHARSTAFSASCSLSSRGSAIIVRNDPAAVYPAPTRLCPEAS